MVNRCRVTKKIIDDERRRLGIQPLSKTIREFRKIEFAGKNQSFFKDLRRDDRKLNEKIKKSLSRNC